MDKKKAEISGIPHDGRSKEAKGKLFLDLLQPLGISDSGVRGHACSTWTFSSFVGLV